jgi:hypothetical protein
MNGCDIFQGGAGPYIYGVDGTAGTCYTVGTSTRCFGGSGGSIRGTAYPDHGGGDGLYIDFIDSMTNAVKMNGKPNTGGGGGGGLNSALNETITQTTLAYASGNDIWTKFGQTNSSLYTPGVTPGSGGSGIAILSYLSAEECPTDLPFYNFDLLSPVCTTCLQYNRDTPLFDTSSGLCTTCPANTPYYDPSTKNCVATCPAPMSPNPNFGNVCAIPPLTCQGGRPYFNGYECASSQVNFSTQGGGNGGNSIINNGGYIVHTFTTSGTFTGPVIPNVTGDVLIVGGGGGGGTYSIESTSNPSSAGGGGGGDVRYLQNFSFGTQSWSITIGQGGLPNQNGGDTSFGENVAAGGGAGSAYPEVVDASSGASGGGGSGLGYPGQNTSGAGFPGRAGDFIAGTGAAGGGGGGKNSQGTAGNINQGGNGGGGIANSITGNSIIYGGGGGGSAVTINGTYVAGGIGGIGGAGGGGAGAGSVVYNVAGYQKTNMVRGENGTPGTGGGGGGGASVASPGPAGYPGNPVTNPGSRGGSGIVIIRYSTANLCQSPLPYFNPGLKICTACGDERPFYNPLSNNCEKCPIARQYWNGIACVAECPTVLPYADKNKICQLPCSSASPNWDGTQCTLVCPDTAPIATNGRCGLCPNSQKWDPDAKTCRQTCLEGVDDSGKICTPCYRKDETKPYWNGNICGPCPAATPYWSGPLTACQACPFITPIYDAANKRCTSCYDLDADHHRPFYNQAQSDYASSSSMRCQPCPVASTPKWNNTTKMCEVCNVPTPYWNVTNRACEVCPASIPYWNSRVCTLPSNIADVNTTVAATIGVNPNNVIDKNSATYWQATGYSGGTYPQTGKRTTRDTAGTLWRGEFIQIETSNNYILSSYLLKSSDLRGWTVLGSNDGFAWNLIDRKNSIINFNQTFYITPPISNAYPLFRLVVTDVLTTTVTINEWTLQTANAVVTSTVSQDKSAFTVLAGAIEGCNTMSCILDKSATTDITDLVYGNYPPTQVGNDVLPDKAQQALSNCSSNVDCGFVEFNFLSDASTFNGTAPYTVSTISTTQSDIGVFQKKYGVTPPPRLKSPPGFKYNYYYIEGTRLGSNLTATVDVCGQACSKNPSCKGFNFYFGSSNCTFYSSISDSEPGYDPARGSFIRDPHILTAEKNTNRIRYTNLTESGATCATMPACNTDILSLIGQIGSTVQSFSTAELDSCNSCPIRSVAKQGSLYTLTNEANIVSNVTTIQAVQSAMPFTDTRTVTHINVMNGGNFIIRPYFKPETTATVNIRPGGGLYSNWAQIWMGSEPFAAGIVPKNCDTVCDPSPPGMCFSYFRPLYALTTKVTNVRTGEICVTTAKGTYYNKTCNGSCGTGTDLDPGTTTGSYPFAHSSSGNPDLLYWELIPVDWVPNGFYIRSMGSEKRAWGIGPSRVKTDAVTLGNVGNQKCKNWKPANLKARPYLKWGSNIGSYKDFGRNESEDEEALRTFEAFVSGVGTGFTGGMADTSALYDKPDGSVPVVFDSFPPQFNTEAYPFACFYADLQTLPSEGPTKTKYDNQEYIFVIEPV